MRAWLILLALFTGDADAKKRKKGEGVVVEVKVLDKEDAGIVATAMIRYPKDETTYRVNEVNGIWKASEIYLSDGDTMHFTPGSSVQLEISAPGYVTQLVQYDVRRWRNKVEISLEKMKIDDKDIEIPTIPFGRDQERDPSTSGAAN